jgi:glycosyltransferase involved in cell wall biosynthesis
MRILHLVGTLNPGGIERLTTELALDQQSHGKQPALCCLLARQGRFLEVLESAGIPIFEAAYGRRPWLLPRRLARVLETFHPDILHTHVNFSLLWQAAALQLAKRIPFVITQHTLLAVSPGVRLRSRLIYRAARPYISRHVTVSTHAAHHAANLYGIDPGSFQVIFNGVDPLDFAYDDDARRRLRAEWHIPNDSVLWGSVGRLDPVKGYDLLLPAFARARQTLPSLQLAIAGGGPQAEALKTLASQLGCQESVHWLGSRRDIPAVLSAFDHYVQTSRKEAAPRAVLEALASGLRVLGSDVGGIREYALKSTDIALIDATEAGTLSAAIIKHSRRQQSEAQRVSRCPPMFTFQAMSAAYQSLYEEIS